ncbi:MAG: TRAP transporter small permease [Geminicoccaceae bacterium]
MSDRGAGSDPSSEFRLDEDEPVDLSDLRPDDSIVFVIFWALAIVVFLQFFSRYVLNSSIGWTEEIARYLLIAVTFVGSVMAVRKRSHIAVEVVQRWLGPRGEARRRLAVDVIAAAFYVAAAWLAADLSLRTKQMMASVDLSKSLIYWVVCAAFVGMAFYALRDLVLTLLGRAEDASSDRPSRSID